MSKLIRIDYLDSNSEKKAVTYLDPSEVIAIRPCTTFTKPTCYVDVDFSTNFTSKGGTLTFMDWTVEKMHTLLFGSK